MTIARSKSPGWGSNETLTSAQANALDINTTYALDKRTGNTDQLASAVTVTGSGSISFANGTTLVTSGSAPSVFSGTVTCNSTVTLSSISTLSAQGAVNFTSISVVTFKSDPKLQTTNLIWDHSGGSIDVAFKHTDNTATNGTGGNTYIRGQNATGTHGTGGDLYLQSGAGTCLTGTVFLYAGAGLSASFGASGANIYTKFAVSGGTLSATVVNATFANPSTTMDFSTGNIFAISAASADTTIVPTNPISGATYTIAYLQDGTGGHALSWGGGYTWRFGALSLSPDTTANKFTVYQFVLVGTAFNCIARNVY